MTLNTLSMVCTQDSCSMQTTDEYLERVLANSPDEFADSVFHHVLCLPPGTVCTGESIRLACQAQGIHPHHPNAWGAAIRRCLCAGLLEETGRFPRMRSASSHNRRNPEYRRAH